MQTQITSQEYRRRFRNLILATWLIPPVFGLSFLLYIDMFSIQQMLDILVSPIEPVFVLAWLFFSLWYFPRKFSLIASALDYETPKNEQAILQRMRSFPLHYWGLFIVYLLMAPTSVIISGEHFSDFNATPIDWFKIHLVALIVSIIVGLPIFFRLLDLFGLVVGRFNVSSPHITLKTKVFLIGALIPLLIDTMLVQYYWTRTGYFTYETFLVWLTLELLAVGGSLIFVHSIGQSLSPLQSLIDKKSDESFPPLTKLRPKSTDELGVLTSDYRDLLSELYNYRYNLEDLVRTRTQELVAMNKELESFAHTVSHDLRTPLRSINGFSMAILEDFGDELDDEVKNHLKKITTASIKMSDIIDALLKLSRVSRGEIKRENIDLSSLMKSMLETHAYKSNDKPVDFMIEPNLAVFADRGLVYVLVENLVNNAVKFTKNVLRPQIKIGKAWREGGEYIYVSDNGVGFDMAYSEKLFQSFQRLHIEQEYDGLGIGLATVHRIIERHGGHIFAESEPGQGARFYFNFDQRKVSTTDGDKSVVNY